MDRPVKAIRAHANNNEQARLAVLLNEACIAANLPAPANLSDTINLCGAFLLAARGHLIVSGVHERTITQTLHELLDKQAASMFGETEVANG